MKGIPGPALMLAIACMALMTPLRADDTDSAGGAGGSDTPVAATAISVQGQVELLDGTDWKPVEEGQLLAEGDRVRTGDSASLHLVLADGSSVALGPDSDLSLRAVGTGVEGSVTLLALARGLLNTIVEKLKPGSRFEVETPSAVAAVKGTDFEVSLSGGGSSVTVNEGNVNLGDPGRSHFEAVRPMERRSLVGNRILAAVVLSPAERSAFRNRWAAAHRLHLQRREILNRFRRTQGARRRQFMRQMQRRGAMRGHGALRGKGGRADGGRARALGRRARGGHSPSRGGRGRAGTQLGRENHSKRDE